MVWGLSPVVLGDDSWFYAQGSFLESSEIKPDQCYIRQHPTFSAIALTPTLMVLMYIMQHSP